MALPRALGPLAPREYKLSQWHKYTGGAPGKPATGAARALTPGPLPARANCEIIAPGGARRVDDEIGEGENHET